MKKIIWPVNFVHFAGGAVAHHHGWAVHLPGKAALLANDFFALVLGAEVRVIVVFGLVEHVLAKHDFVQAGSGHRADMVKMTHLDSLGKLDRVAGAFDVDRHLVLRVGVQVIHRCQVVELADVALGLFGVFGASENPLARLC